MAEISFLMVNGDSGIVSNLLSGTCKFIEKGGFSGIGIAGKGHGNRFVTHLSEL
jgi:hypothetical protein